MTNRIIHVDTEPGWRGGENQVFLLVRGLRADHEQVVVCRRGEALAARIRELGVATVEVADRGLGGLRAALALRGQLAARSLVHAHTSRAHGLARAAILGTNTPLVVTRRVDFAVGGGLTGGWKYGRRVSRFVAISAAIREILHAGGVDPSQLTVIPSGVDFAALDAAPRHDLRAELGLAADALVVLNVAALVDHKDHRTLLTAWRAVETALPHTHLVIAGDGELRVELHAVAHQLGLTRVHWLGQRSDVPSLLKNAQLFALSSHLEGLGTSLMDALRCGVPAVATRAGGIPEVVRDGDDGRLVPPRDPAAFAAALIDLLRDAPVRQALAGRARGNSERFADGHMVAAYRRLYAELLGG